MSIDDHRPRRRQPPRRSRAVSSFATAQSFAAVWAAHAGPDAIAADRRFRDEDGGGGVRRASGRRPGYGVSIAAGTRRKTDALVIVVEETSPDPSRRCAQVMSSPYPRRAPAARRWRDSVQYADPHGPEHDHLQAVASVRRRRHPLSMDAKGRRASDAESSDRAGFDRGERSVHRPDAAGRGGDGLSRGPFSGALLLATERDQPLRPLSRLAGAPRPGRARPARWSRFLAARLRLLFVSPTAFWVMLWLSAIDRAWPGSPSGALCLFQASRGRLWKLPRWRLRRAARR